MVYPWAVVIGIGVGIAGLFFMMFQERQNRERHGWHGGGGADVGPDSWDSPSNFNESGPIPRRRRHIPSDDGSCTICLDQISQESHDIQTLHCSHSFHSKCIKKWFEEKNLQICPVCRHQQ